MNIYYAHHQWKYGTKIEEYEIDVIIKHFSDSNIFNPSVDLKRTIDDGEEAIMHECLETVRNSDILVFSSMDGIVGYGVYHEVEEARRNDIGVFYIYQNKLYRNVSLIKIDENDRTDRLYAFVKWEEIYI